MKIRTITELLYIKEKLQDTQTGLIAAYDALHKLSSYDYTCNEILDLAEGVGREVLDVSQSINYRLKIEKITDK